MSNVNVQIAINWATANLALVKAGGSVAFPMFEGASRHDFVRVRAGLMATGRVASVTGNKRLVHIVSK